MSTALTAKKTINIRDIESIQEMRDVEALQREVWGPGDVVPLTHLVATKESGGILIGAFDKDQVVGFAYGFIGHDKGQLMIHSHMLAVKPEYRNLGLGYKLKLAQRERTQTMGFNRVTWTFDPLQSRNAHLNFSKLGVIADRYKIDFYGEESTSSIGFHLGTDRLWVTWLLDSRRVIDRIEGGSTPEDFLSRLDQAVRLVQLGDDGLPYLSNLAEGSIHKYALIEIPHDITLLELERPEAAMAWRQATRRAFILTLNSGYIVMEFCRQNVGKRLGVYLLTSEKSVKALI